MAGYTTLAEVKALCRVTDASHDTEITASLEDAGYYTDALIQLHETVPLVSPPDPIKRANKYLAAALFYYHNPTTEQMIKQAERWWYVGEIMLNSYIIHKYYQGEMKS